MKVNYCASPIGGSGLLMASTSASILSSSFRFNYLFCQTITSLFNQVGAMPIGDIYLAKEEDSPKGPFPLFLLFGVFSFRERSRFGLPASIVSKVLAFIS